MTYRPYRRASRVRYAVASAVAALAVLAATGCGSDEAPPPPAGAEQPPFSLVESGYLTIAFQDGGLPRVSAKDGDALVGTWGYLVTKFAGKYGLKLKLMATDTSGEILAVSNKRADMGAAIYNRPNRQTVVRFLDYDTYDNYFVAVPRSLGYTSPASLAGKTIGVASGFSVVPDLQKSFGAANVKQFQTYALGVQALKNGQIDAYFNTMPILGLIGPNNPDIGVHSLKTGDFGIPADRVSTPEGPVVACGNDALSTAYNTFFREVVKTEEYKSVWRDAWTAVGAPDPLAAMVVDQLPVTNGC